MQVKISYAITEGEHEMQEISDTKIVYKNIGKIFFALVCFVAIRETLPLFYQISTKQVINSSVNSIVAGFIGLLIFLIFRGKKLFTYDMKVTAKKMNGKSFLKFFICVFAVQSVMAWCIALTESVLNGAGITMYRGIFDTNVASIPAMTIIEGVLIGPLIEEIVFRGAVMRTLESKGKVLAILISAILFGFYHCAFMQGMFAVLVGIIFAYVAIEYSLKWALFLHCINNFLAGGLNMAKYAIPVGSSWVIEYGIPVIFLILAIIVCAKDKDTIKDYVQSNRPEKGCYKNVFRSVWLWVFLISTFLLAATTIQKL